MRLGSDQASAQETEISTFHTVEIATDGSEPIDTSMFPAVMLNFAIVVRSLTDDSKLACSAAPDGCGYKWGSCSRMYSTESGRVVLHALPI